MKKKFIFQLQYLKTNLKSRFGKYQSIPLELTTNVMQHQLKQRPITIL